MNTFLLYWNPYFSSYKMDRFMDDFDFPEGVDFMTADDRNCDRFPGDFNWSIVEHEKVREGDRFVFVKVGYSKPTGIIGVGHFLSEPYEDEDWSGQGHKVFYMDMEWETVIKPSSDKILKTEILKKVIPEVNWTKGHAGVEVSPEVAEKIEKLWRDHLKELKIRSLAEDEFTTLMHYEFFADEYTRDEFMAMDAYARIRDGEDKDTVLKENGITAEFYDANIERILAKP